MPKFYQTPGGTFSTAEKQWKDDMRAEGLDPKTYTGRKTIDVPTKAAELMEFLTFHNVNVINPQAAPAPEVTGGGSNPPHPEPSSVAPDTTVPNLDEMFQAAPLRCRLDLAITAIEAADKQLNGPWPPIPGTK